MLRRSLFGLLPLPFIKTKEYSKEFNDIWYAILTSLKNMDLSSLVCFITSSCDTQGDKYLHILVGDKVLPHAFSINQRYNLHLDEINEIIIRINKIKKGQLWNRNM